MQAKSKNDTKISVPTAAHRPTPSRWRPVISPATTTSDALGRPWQENTHRSWSLEAAYTYTHIVRESFGLRYLYSHDRHSQLSDVYDYDYLPQLRKMLFASGGRSSTHYTAPEIGAVQRFARKRLLLRERIGMGVGFTRVREYHDTGFGLHANAELECRITKRLGVRLGVTTFGSTKWYNIYNRDFFITRPIEYIGRPKTSLVGTNYTLGLNIDL